MKRYQIDGSADIDFSVVVDADSKEAAENKAKEILESAIFEGDITTHGCSVHISAVDLEDPDEEESEEE